MPSPTRVSAKTISLPPLRPDPEGDDVLPAAAVLCPASGFEDLLQRLREAHEADLSVLRGEIQRQQAELVDQVEPSALRAEIHKQQATSVWGKSEEAILAGPMTLASTPGALPAERVFSMQSSTNSSDYLDPRTMSEVDKARSYATLTLSETPTKDQARSNATLNTQGDGTGSTTTTATGKSKKGAIFKVRNENFNP